jgi:hypothetical protein
MEAREQLLAQLEALTESSEDTPDETDQLLNEFADRAGAEPTPSAPPPSEPEVVVADPTYSPANAWFLGMDMDQGRLSLCLTDSHTGRTYPLQFVNGDGTRRDDRLIDGEWQLTANLASRLSQTSQRQLEDQMQNLWDSVVAEVRHPNLPAQDLPRIFQNLQGIIVSQPHQSSDAYAVHCRQTLLEVGWTKAPELVLVIDRALAPLLAIKHQGADPHTDHLCLQVSPQTIVLSLTGSPPRTAQLSSGLAQFQEQATQLLFGQLGDMETARHFYSTCQQALASDPSLIQWEYEWQHQPAAIHRHQWEQAHQQALRQWVEPLAHHINQLVSTLANPHYLDLWLIGKIPSVLKEWLCAKLIPAHIRHLSEKAIAQGLSVAPFYRDYLDIGRLQYSDYFLLQELCALRLPDPCEVDLILQTLHNRGVNVRACGDRLREILTNGLPPQLGLASEFEQGVPLFQPTSDGKLSPCREVMVVLRSHLQQFQYGLRQNLAEPLVFPHYR